MIPIEFLNEAGEFFIQTTANEKFKLTKEDMGYEFIDINPPVLEKKIQDFKSCKIPKAIEKTLSIRSKSVDPSKIIFFDGIAKGFKFVFYEKGDMVLTKGTINALYIEKTIHNFFFRVHLLEQPGRKIAIEEFNGDFKIETEDETLLINYIDENYYYEGRKIINFYSLFEAKGKHFDIDINTINESDVSPYYIFYNRPLIILTEDPEQENRVKMSFQLSNVKTIVKY